MLLAVLTVMMFVVLLLAASESLLHRSGRWRFIIALINGQNARTDEIMASLFIVANAGTVGLWSLVAAHPPFLDSQAEILWTCLALYGGGFASIVGLPISLFSLFWRRGVSRWIWTTCLLMNTAGMMANVICFVIYVAPAC